MRYKLGVAAQAKCKDRIRRFAECCSDKTFTVVFACRTELNEMNACLKHWCVPRSGGAGRRHRRARAARAGLTAIALARRRKTEEQMRFFKEQWVALRCPETGFEPRLRDDDDAPR